MTKTTRKYMVYVDGKYYYDTKTKQWRDDGDIMGEFGIVFFTTLKSIVKALNRSAAAKVFPIGTSVEISEVIYPARLHKGVGQPPILGKFWEFLSN